MELTGIQRTRRWQWRIGELGLSSLAAERLREVVGRYDEGEGPFIGVVVLQNG
jgi:hypothetical protein